ncbi:TMEM165/GDT1 family protein [Nocardia tengchongensis]|uniref:GDT1 family protein n=1 Tax=Nocardia tengchongensis TaxID=2055889 RepID=A0ABX8CRX0_9NOCA|nr:TMEM165/GDT1 family protein [Nocardia tengchongensis]QVI22633.1 TMEM165/GDT1 family protein [Nocardia tengchongensis]
MIATVLLSFGVLFLAELGDKSQLMALTFALRYHWWVVLSGITVASVLVNLIAVGVGHFLGAALPTGVISLFAAATLIGVGLWTLRESLSNSTDEGDEAAPQTRSRSAFLVVLSAFLLAELGDRTMFATMALATNNNWVAVWIGSVAGMVAAGGLAIVIGVTVGKHIPERIIAVCSGLLFLYFGALTLLEAFAHGLGTPLAALLSLALPALAGAVLLLLRRRAASPASVLDHYVAEQIPAAPHEVQ